MITEEERKAILGKWTYLADYPFYYSRRFWKGVSAALLLSMAFGGLVLAWNVTLRRKVREKTRELTWELEERRRIDAALRRNRHRLATLVGNLPGMVYRHPLDAEGIWPLRFTSKGCHKLTGYRKLDSPGRETLYYHRIVHPEDRERRRRRVREALDRREPYELTYRIVTAEGGIKWVWEQGLGIFDEAGESPYVEGFITDITVYKLAEESLTQSRKLFQDLVDHSPIGISIIQDRRIVYGNPEQRRIFGPLPEGCDIGALPNVHPEDAGRAWAFFEAIALGRTDAGEPDLRLLRHGEGEERELWVHCRAAPVEYRGKPSILLLMLDITHAKELEQIVSVKDKMASLGRVAAGIAHEIRNPLSVVHLYLSAIGKACRQGAPPETISENLPPIREAAGDIETVIRQVMDFARPSAPAFGRTDLNRPVRQALAMCGAFLRRGEIRLEAALSEAPLPCSADANLLQRVVLNLLTNAAEAMGAQDREKVIRVRSSAEKGHLFIRVSDSGPGVPEKQRKNIFDPFYTTKCDGTGIGLSLSQRIVADHMGKLTVEESELGGARFVIELPLEKG